MIGVCSTAEGFAFRLGGFEGQGSAHLRFDLKILVRDHVVSGIHTWHKQLCKDLNQQLSVSSV